MNKKKTQRKKKNQFCESVTENNQYTNAGSRKQFEIEKKKTNKTKL